jgi:hypothetical protein
MIMRRRGLYGAAPEARWPALERRMDIADDGDGDEVFEYDSGYCPEEVRQAAEATAVAARDAQVAALGGPAVGTYSGCPPTFHLEGMPLCPPKVFERTWTNDIMRPVGGCLSMLSIHLRTAA